MLKSRDIKAAASEVGFDLCGIASVRNLSAEREFFEGWLAKGYDSGLDYLRRNVGKRFSPQQLMPGARSIICCGIGYKNDTSMGYEGYPDVPKIASYGRGSIYQNVIKEMLRQMAARLVELSGDFGWRVFSDTAPVLEKRWAVEAGLGFIGRNTLLISPGMGSFILLGELIVDVLVDSYDTPYGGPGCGRCRLCIDRCPNGALTPDGIDTTNCIARITIEKPSGQAVSGAESLHGWIFGCDECQSVCPYNKMTPLSANPRLRPLTDPRRISRQEWLTMTEEEFDTRFGDTPLARTGLGRLKVNLK